MVAQSQERRLSSQARVTELTKAIDALYLNDTFLIPGAYKLNPEAAGFKWYFDTIGAHSVALDGQHNPQTEAYLSAYLTHTTEPGRAVKDYPSVVYDLNTEIADSDDSYASTILSLASYYSKKGGSSWFTDHLDALKAVGQANLLDTLNPEFKLTYTFNSSPGRSATLDTDKRPYQRWMQFMDNCESARGLQDFADALPTNDPKKAAYAQAAADVVEGLQNQFDTNNQAFIFRADKNFTSDGQSTFYPGRLCQIFPQAYGVSFGADTKRLYDAGWKYLNARGDQWWKGDIKDNSVRINKNYATNFPHMEIGYVAALRGDYEHADAQLSYFLDNLPKKHEYEAPFGDIQELGWALRTARILGQQKSRFSVGDVTVSEKDRVANFEVRLAPPSPTPVTVNFTTTDGTALSSSDYLAKTGTLTFEPGTTVKKVSVSIVDDKLNEGDEQFTIKLSSAGTTRILDAIGVGTIQDNDAIPTFAVTAPKVTEGAAGTTTKLSFPIKLSAASGRAVQAKFVTMPGSVFSATSGVDYSALGGTLTFTPGETTKSVDVVVKGDDLDEEDEHVALQLSNPINATLGTKAVEGRLTSDGIIVDDDGAPSLSINDVSLTEGNGGIGSEAKTATFTVAMSAKSGREVRTNFATVRGTATQGVDYVGLSGSLTFTPGQVKQTISVKINGDATFESDEQFQVVLSRPVNATLAKDKGIGTIRNDDRSSTGASSATVSAWYNDGWERESHNVFLANSDLFSNLNPFYYNLGTSDTGAGKVDTSGSIYLREYAYGNGEEVEQIHAKGAKCVPAISDGAVGQINAIFANPTFRQTLITNLANEAVTKDFDGFDLDFESGVAANGGKAAYTAFIKDLAAALKAKGKVLDVTIGAFEDASRESDWIMDIDGLKALADVRYFKIMGYDKCLRPELRTSPHPIGELGWVKACLNYMVVQRGLPASKTLLGIPNYSWTWKRSGAEYTLADQIEPYSSIMSHPGIKVTWNSVTAESTATWSDASSYEAAVSDSQSVSARSQLVKSYGLGGIALFVLGREDRNIYPALRAILKPGTGSTNSS